MKFICYCSKTLSPAVSKFLIVTGLSLSFVSCKWGDEINAIVQPNPDDIAVLISDTNTVSMSTLKVDSLMTGASTRHLVGRFTDPYLGKMHATTFIQVGTDGALTLPETAVYDSLVLSLRYDGYYYGDTTKVMTVSVHELTSDLTLKPDLTPIDAIYNYHSTPYDPAPLARKKFYPRPRPNSQSVGTGTNRLDLKIKLTDVLGKKIFDHVKANKITNSAQWIDLLKGLTIIPATADNHAVVGFVQGEVNLRLFHHSPDAVEGVDKDSVSVGLVASYNQTGGDRTGTVLAKLPNTYRSALPSTQTGNMSFVQAGSGIMTRLDFPGVRHYKSLDYLFVNSARLIIDPIKNSNTRWYPLPATLHAYWCDKNNDYVYSSGSPLAAPTATLQQDYINDRQYYVIDVTEYVANILQSGSNDTYGLLLRTSSPFATSGVPSGNILDGNTDFSKSFDRVILGDQSNPSGRMKLELKYTNIKK